jgi:thiamine transport system permease protein
MKQSARLALLAPAAVVVAAAAGVVPLVVFAVRTGGRFGVDTYTWHVLAFTLLQAALSTLLSLALAIPAARALAFHPFTGRGLLLGLFAVPQALPSIVVVLALVELYGQSGWFGGILNLYGLPGILLAHVFFNLPLALRFCLEALESASPENLRLADQLGLTGSARWRHVEWPVMRTMLPRLAALIFLLCAASFVVVLTLGGPAATTLEVAIYQSLRMDFDVSRAVTLALLQAALCLVLVAFAGQLAAPSPAVARVRLLPPTRLRMGAWGIVTLVLVVILVLPPLAALAASGVQSFMLRPVLYQALATSLLVATLSACLSMLLAWPLASLQVRAIRWRGFFASVSLLGLILPPAVLATGWFILLRGSSAGIASSMILISLLNALMALPFSLTLLASVMAVQVLPQDRLCEQLGLSGWTRFRLIDRPALMRPLAQAFLVAFILSFGDLTAVMMLGSQGVVTLPALIAAEMGQYRSVSAQGTALLLAGLCLVGTLAANRLGRTS